MGNPGYTSDVAVDESSDVQMTSHDVGKQRG